jgi:hypothetical protein
MRESSAMTTERYDVRGQSGLLVEVPTRRPARAGLRCPGPRGPDSNRHHSDGQSGALPVELPRGRTEDLCGPVVIRKALFETRPRRSEGSPGRIPKCTPTATTAFGRRGSAVEDRSRQTNASRVAFEGEELVNAMPAHDQARYPRRATVRRSYAEANVRKAPLEVRARGRLRK